MELFLNLYKKQVVSVLLILIIFAVISVLNSTEATALSLISIGGICFIFSAINIAKHMTTPAAFRRCDIRFVVTLVSLAVFIFCAVQLVQMTIL